MEKGDEGGMYYYLGELTFKRICTLVVNNKSTDNVINCELQIVINKVKLQFFYTMATNADDFEEFHHKLRNNDGDRSESEEPSPTSNNLDILIQHLTKRDALLERLVDKLTVGTTPMSTTSNSTSV
ncbi:hypothetical protein QE152_g41440, partial [Popillia japonica]